MGGSGSATTGTPGGTTRRWQADAQRHSGALGDVLANAIDVVDQDDDPVGDLLEVAAVLHLDAECAPVGNRREKVGTQLELPVPAALHVEFFAAHLPLSLAEPAASSEQREGHESKDAAHATDPFVARSIVPPPRTRSPA